MSSMKVECVVKTSALIGEGPVWEEPEQTLLFVDIAGKKIHRWSPTTNQIQSVDTGQPISMQGIFTCALYVTSLPDFLSLLR